MGELIKINPMDTKKNSDYDYLKTNTIEQGDARLQPTPEVERLVLVKFRKKSRLKFDLKNKKFNLLVMERYGERIMEAINILEDYTKKYKAGSRVYKKLAEAYDDLGYIEKAEPYLKKAISLNRKDISCYLKLIDYYNDEDYNYDDNAKTELSINCLQQALKYHALHPILHYELSRVLKKVNPKKSKSHLERARILAHNGKYRINYDDKMKIEVELINTCEGYGEYDKVIELTESLMQMGYADKDICITRANSYYKIGDKDKAIEWYNEALKFSEKSSNIMFSLASLHREKYDYRKSLEYLEMSKNVLEESSVRHKILENMMIISRIMARYQLKREMKENSPPMRKGG